ncbi:MAG: hypothetical protein QM767_25135 [Anaeromyxobacter sp.]
MPPPVACRAVRSQRPGRAQGTEASALPRSVFFQGTWAAIQVDVPR